MLLWEHRRIFRINGFSLSELPMMAQKEMEAKVGPVLIMFMKYLTALFLEVIEKK